MKRLKSTLWAHKGIVFGWLSVALVLGLGEERLATPSQPALGVLLFVWLLAAILGAAFSVVRHADELAHRMGDPFGTLILTLCVTGMEVVIVSLVMVSGEGEPTLAREAMFSVVMLAMTGFAGVALLSGAFKHQRQDFNLDGSNAYLSLIIPLSIFGLVLPNFTTTTEGPTLSTAQAAALSLLCVGAYVVFLGIQTVRHREFFEGGGEEQAHPAPQRSSRASVALLVASLLPVVMLAEGLAKVLEFGIHRLHAPTGLAGIVVAGLIMAPEGLSSLKAARANNMQRAINLLLGSALATIALTIPSILTVGFLTHRTVVLGLPAKEIALLVTTLAVSLTTYSRGRTNVLQGAVHLLIFLMWLVLVFQG